MTISKDTELSEILKSEEVIDEICTKMDDAISLLSERAKTLSSETSSGKGLCEEQIVGDVPEFYNSATELYSNCTELMVSLSEFKNSVAAISIEKEKDELIELRKCLVEDNEAIDSLISGYELSYSNAKNYMPTEKSSQLYEEYKGANGYITLESAKKERNNEKIEEIDLRLDGDLANNVKGLSDLYKMYGATYDENGRVTKYGELDTSGGGRKMCDENGHELNPDFEETPDVEAGKKDDSMTTDTNSTITSDNAQNTPDGVYLAGKNILEDKNNNGNSLNSLGQNSLSNTGTEYYKKTDGTICYKDSDGNLKEVIKPNSETTTPTTGVSNGTTTDSLFNVAEHPIYGYVTLDNGKTVDVFCDTDVLGKTKYYIKDPIVGYIELTQNGGDGSPKKPTYSIIGNEYTIDEITEY